MGISTTDHEVQLRWSGLPARPARRNQAPHRPVRLHTRTILYPQGPDHRLQPIIDYMAASDLCPARPAIEAHFQSNNIHFGGPIRSSRPAGRPADGSGPSGLLISLPQPGTPSFGSTLDAIELLATEISPASDQPQPSHRQPPLADPTPPTPRFHHQPFLHDSEYDGIPFQRRFFAHDGRPPPAHHRPATSPPSAASTKGTSMTTTVDPNLVWRRPSGRRRRLQRRRHRRDRRLGPPLDPQRWAGGPLHAAVDAASSTSTPQRPRAQTSPSSYIHDALSAYPSSRVDRHENGVAPPAPGAWALLGRPQYLRAAWTKPSGIWGRSVRPSSSFHHVDPRCPGEDRHPRRAAAGRKNPPHRIAEASDRRTYILRPRVAEVVFGPRTVFITTTVATVLAEQTALGIASIPCALGPAVRCSRQAGRFEPHGQPSWKSASPNFILAWLLPLPRRRAISRRTALPRRPEHRRPRHRFQRRRPVRDRPDRPTASRRRSHRPPTPLGTGKILTPPNPPTTPLNLRPDRSRRSPPLAFVIALASRCSGAGSPTSASSTDATTEAPETAMTATLVYDTDVELNNLDPPANIDMSNQAIVERGRQPHLPRRGREVSPVARGVPGPWPPMGSSTPSRLRQDVTFPRRRAVQRRGGQGRLRPGQRQRHRPTCSATSAAHAGAGRRRLHLRDRPEKAPKATTWTTSPSRLGDHRPRHS